MFLVDTDVLSALRRRERHPKVVAWLSKQRDSELHLSVVTIGEVERGIAQQQSRDPLFARALSAWLENVLTLYANRVLPIDLATARRWGKLTAQIGHSSADLLIAATALEHGLTVVTHNVRHFKPSGVPVVDPLA